MKTKLFPNLLGVLLMSFTSIFIISCDKDDDTPGDPTDTVTLNMLDEQSGKTLLGASDVYINKANNFRTSSSLIADAGNAAGVGVKLAPKVSNLVKEAAVTPGHIYQIFDKKAVRDFPSGNLAVQLGAAYYQAYVVSPIAINNSTGAVVKYISVYPDGKNLPEWDHDLGVLYNMGETIEMDLPKGAECFFEEHSGGESGSFEISTADGRLTITLIKSPNHISGPWGTYTTYIRLGNVFTSVLVNVK